MNGRGGAIPTPDVEALASLVPGYRAEYQDALDLFASVAHAGRERGLPAMLDLSGRSSEWLWEGLNNAGLFYQRIYRYRKVADDLLPGWHGHSRVPVVRFDLPVLTPERVTDRNVGHRLQAIDHLRRHERLLRAGWLWLAGTVFDSRRQEEMTVCCPIVTAPVALHGVARVDLLATTAGDAVFHSLFSDGPRATWADLFPVPIAALRSAGGPPELTAAVRLLVNSLGWTIDEFLPPTANPRTRRFEPGLALIPGVAMYVDPSTLSAGQHLAEWKRAAGASRSAFASMYGTPRGPATGSRPLDSNQATRPLDVDQRLLVTTAAREPLLAVTGPPGTGKTHALCEIAMDAIGRGESVLIGAKSHFAVEVLAQQLSAVDGPVPVLFGSSVSGEEFASRMTDLLASALRPESYVDFEEVVTARRKLEASRRRVADRVLIEQQVRDLHAQPDRAERLKDRLDRQPGIIDQLTGVVEATDRPGSLGPVRRWLTARRLNLDRSRLEEHARDELSGLIAVKRLVEANAAAPDSGSSRSPLHGVDAVDGLLHESTQDDALLAGLMDDEQRCHRSNAAWLRTAVLRALTAGRKRRQAAQQVATAARADREQRRRILQQLDVELLAGAAPLWLGTVGDIDDVLPTQAAMFDLLILDEASQLDQVSTAGALFRASRAVICGDPRQLRHSSPPGATSELAVGPIDVANDSIYDRAVAVAPIVALTRHYRSDPHLIDFSAQRFYGSNMSVATRRPGNDGADLIDVIRLDGHSDNNGVNQAEIDEVLQLLGSAAPTTGGSIGVVTPFTSQAEAMTDAVAENVDSAKILNREIEVGTVQAFQGAEFDLVIASLVVDDPDDDQWRYVNDRQRFNVMVTRARRRMVVVTSVDKPPGLAGDYVRYAERGPDSLSGRHQAPSGQHQFERRWRDDVAAVLTDAGFQLDADYPVGGYTVDLVVRNASGQRGEPVAVCCWPSDDHLERELLLHRMGWKVAYAFRSEWSGRLPRLAIELGQQLTWADMPSQLR